MNDKVKSRNIRENPVVRATRAAQVIDNPEFQQAFAGARDAIVNEMERLTLTGDNDAHAARLVMKLQAAKEFKSMFVSLIAAGERAVKREERRATPTVFDPLGNTSGANNQ